MINREFGNTRTDSIFLLYLFSTIFMVFFSVHAIHNWPGRWAQLIISLVCLLVTILVVIKYFPKYIRNKNLPKEIIIALAIMLLGVLNVYFSEDCLASMKGMGLFLMSGILNFIATFFLFQSRHYQRIFLYLCSICFIAIIIFGLFEYVQGIYYKNKTIFLFSSNPIPAGSLLILLAAGPIILFVKTKDGAQKLLLFLSLLLGIILIILIGKRGPFVALLAMVLVWIITRKYGFLKLTLMIFLLGGFGYQFGKKIPLHYKNQLLRQDTVLVRLEFYNIAWQVIKNKPYFGVGFNAPIKRFIPESYKAEIYSDDGKHSFADIIKGVETFDNMGLFFLGQTGLIFSLAYVFLIFTLIKKLVRNYNQNCNAKAQSILLVTILFGFAVHSMTYDSLRYPHLNWLFHSLLGLMANCNLFHSNKPDGVIFSSKN